MKTLLALLLAIAPNADAQTLRCWIPQPPEPCKPYLVEGNHDRNHAELLRCVLADNTALRAYVRQAYFALTECAAKVPK